MKKIKMIGLILFLIVMMSSCNEKQEISIINGPLIDFSISEFPPKIEKSDYEIFIDSKIKCLDIKIKEEYIDFGPQIKGFYFDKLYINNKCGKEIIYHGLDGKKEINIGGYGEDFNNFFSVLEFYFKGEKEKKYYAKIEGSGKNAKNYPYGFEYGKFYYSGREIMNVDYDTFEMLLINKYEYYAKDKNHLFYKGNIVEGFNIKKLNYLKYGGNYIIKDNKNLYLNGKIINNSDSETFEILEYGYAKDKNNIYYTNLYCGSCGLKIIDKNDGNFKVLNENYAKNKKNVFYRGEILYNVNSKTFKIISEYKGKDKNYVYKGAETIIGNGYNIKNGKLYYDNYIVKNIDLESFKYLGDSYALDKDFVYHNNDRKELGSSKYFKSLGNGFGIDDKNVYYVGYIIKGASINNFEIIGKFYFKDIKNVFYVNKILEKADLNTFKYIKYNFGKDKNNAYFGGKIIEGVDLKTFEIINEKKVKDKNREYNFKYGKLIK